MKLGKYRSKKDDQECVVAGWGEYVDSVTQYMLGCYSGEGWHISGENSGDEECCLYGDLQCGGVGRHYFVFPYQKELRVALVGGRCIIYHRLGDSKTLVMKSYEFEHEFYEI